MKGSIEIEELVRQHLMLKAEVKLQKKLLFDFLEVSATARGKKFDSTSFEESYQVLLKEFFLEEVTALDWDLADFLSDDEE